MRLLRLETTFRWYERSREDVLKFAMEDATWKT
jgi:hypothetical protein